MEIYDPYELFEVKGENIRLNSDNSNLEDLTEKIIKEKCTIFLNMGKNYGELNISIKKNNITLSQTYTIEACLKFDDMALKPIYDSFVYQKILYYISSYLNENGIESQPLYSMCIDPSLEFAKGLPEKLKPLGDRAIWFGDGSFIVVDDECSLNYSSPQYQKINKKIFNKELHVINQINIATNEMVDDLKRISNNSTIKPDRFGWPKYKRNGFLFFDGHNIKDPFIDLEATRIKFSQLIEEAKKNYDKRAIEN